MIRLALVLTLTTITLSAHASERPNILFAIADDWSWPHASAYGAKEIDTPGFDRVAEAGVLFSQAFVVAPQCSPNRASILTGRPIWQLEEAGTHNSVFPNTYPVFVDLLDTTGYHVGFTGKGWSPGDAALGGWGRNPAGPEYNKQRKRPPHSGISDFDYAANFDDFLEERDEDQPIFFWYGAKEPHRSYRPGIGLKAGKNPDAIDVPGFLPDVPEIREDLLDYRVEIEWFDQHLVRMLDRLESMGELDNTLVVVTGDNGMPFPRAKANLYEFGTRVPFVAAWPAAFEGGRTSDALVTFTDLATTFLDAGEAAVPAGMSSISLLPLLRGEAPPREFVLTGRERHSHARFDNWGYPARAIRTQEFLYIWNIKPDRWPAGAPPKFYDVDPCPTETFLLENEEAYAQYLAWSYGKRPEHELYDIRTDVDCIHNLAEVEAHAETLERLRAQLIEELTEDQDPRATGRGDIFESYPRFGGMRPALGGFAERGQYNPAYLQEGQVPYID